MYLMYYRWLRSGSIPRDDNLIKQLSNVLLDDTDPNRRIKLKPKKDIKAVLRMSPDEADASVLTFAGGGEDALELDDLLQGDLTKVSDSQLREVYKAYVGNDNYAAETYMDDLSGGNVLDKLDKQW